MGVTHYAQTPHCLKTLSLSQMSKSVIHYAQTPFSMKRPMQSNHLTNREAERPWLEEDLFKKTEKV